ncbi:MAG: helix-turn-helix domain-containing protein [Syntrophotaleaceae bacterium]
MNCYRLLSSQTKAIIVLEGLAGRAAKDICREYNITESQYRRWRQLFLRLSPQVFEWNRGEQREKPGKRAAQAKRKTRKEKPTCRISNSTAAN